MHLRIHWKPWGMTQVMSQQMASTMQRFHFIQTWKQLLQVESSLSLILYCFITRTSIKNTTWRPNFQHVKLNFLINLKTTSASRVNPWRDCEQWNFTIRCTKRKSKLKKLFNMSFISSIMGCKAQLISQEFLCVESIDQPRKKLSMSILTQCLKTCLKIIS